MWPWLTAVNQLPSKDGSLVDYIESQVTELSGVPARENSYVLNKGNPGSSATGAAQPQDVEPSI